MRFLKPGPEQAAEHTAAVAAAATGLIGNEGSVARAAAERAGPVVRHRAPCRDRLAARLERRA